MPGSFGSGAKQQGSSFGMASVQPGSFVSWGDDKYGRVVSVSGKNATVMPKDKTQSVSVAVSDLKVSGSAAMRQNMGGNFGEALENIVAFGVITRLQGVDFLSNQTYSYAIACGLYEFLFKDLMSPLADFLQSPSIPAGTERSIFQGEDFRDVLRRAPMIFIIQQVVQKFAYKKGMSAHWAQNLLSGAVGNYATNVLDRYLFSDEKKAYQYT